MLRHGWLDALHIFTSRTFNDSLIVAPALERSQRGYVDLVSPYGYAGLLSANLTCEHLRRFSEALKEDGIVCSYFTLNPLLSDKRLNDASDYCRRNVSYAFNLRLSVDELYKNLIGRKRSQIRLKDGAKFIEERSRLLDVFCDLYATSMERMKGETLYRFDSQTLRKLCESEQTVLLGVELDNQIVTVTLSGWANQFADFLLSGSTHQGRKYSAALLWKNMLFFKSKNMTFFNLGGGISEGDGLAKFKSRLGGEVFQYGALKMVHNLDVYRDLCDESGANYGDRSGFFPAYAMSESMVDASLTKVESDLPGSAIKRVLS